MTQGEKKYVKLYKYFDREKLLYLRDLKANTGAQGGMVELDLEDKVHALEYLLRKLDGLA